MSKEWERGGLVDQEGHVGKPVPSGAILVPGEIELDRHSIRWELGGPARLQEVSQSTLEEFTNEALNIVGDRPMGSTLAASVNALVKALTHPLHSSR